MYGSPIGSSRTASVTKRACIRCAARISAYADPAAHLCSPCQGSHAPTDQELDDAAMRLEPKQPNHCFRGHDQAIHAMPFRVGRFDTRRCRLCVNLRQRAYRVRRRISATK